ncbi:C-jun-amino-terminal kinase-interacting protein 4 [Zootermopsis nevadensis]|uniref:C-jun-amino-terminal kinase-interacting protein 4 n=1 Tax=Zootermopsis nevadensis TaxID=136037 RepID=A0A067QSP3_ZOONE|nr:C-jun-amino-terminal kinase-interacting protein 4 [Zootermopsis nevadensis]
MEKGEGEIPEKATGSEVENLDQELRKGENLCRESQELEIQLSSLVWICTSIHAASKATVIDANNPADILESFSVVQLLPPLYCKCASYVHRQKAIVQSFKHFSRRIHFKPSTPSEIRNMPVVLSHVAACRTRRDS